MENHISNLNGQRRNISDITNEEQQDNVTETINDIDVNLQQKINKKQKRNEQQRARRAKKREERNKRERETNATNNLLSTPDELTKKRKLRNKRERETNATNNLLSTPDELTKKRKLRNEKQRQHYAKNKETRDNNNNIDMTKPNETEFNSNDIRSQTKLHCLVVGMARLCDANLLAALQYDGTNIT
jgi:hypothetical protein